MDKLFRNVMVETYNDHKSDHLRVRPCSDQDLNTSWNIRFPRDLRNQFQVGQKFYCDLVEGNKQYILKSEVRLIQTITFSHAGKKVAEELKPVPTSKSIETVQKEKALIEMPKLGQRKLKF